MGNFDAGLTTYQYMDGNNQTLLMGNYSQPVTNNFTLSAGVGYMTSSKDDNAFVLDAKGKYKINDNLNLQLRVRNSINGENNTTQVRFSPSWNQHLGRRTSIYVNPYYAYKHNYNTNQDSHTFGGFAGAEIQLNGNSNSKVRVYAFGEGQCYNFEKIGEKDPSIWSANAGLRVNF